MATLPFPSSPLPDTPQLALPMDPESRIRLLWTQSAIPQAKQDATLAEITAKAQPGARVGPFVLPLAPGLPVELGIPCPTCHATRGEACVGRPLLPHPLRTRAWFSPHAVPDYPRLPPRLR